MVSKIKKDPTVTKQQRMVIDIIHTANWLDERISKVLKGFGITHHPETYHPETYHPQSEKS